MAEKGVWRTIRGRRVFIKEGQSLQDAMKESGKFDNLDNKKPSEMTDEEREKRIKELEKEFEKTSMFDSKKQELRDEIEMLKENFDGTREEYIEKKKRTREERSANRQNKEQIKQNKIEEIQRQREQLQEDIKNSPKNKVEQYNIIQENNPMMDDYHTGIRSPKDIKTFDEVIDDEESFVWGDFSQEDARKALETGYIDIYSSKQIGQGTFVSTSKIQAEEYAGGSGSKVYHKKVPLNEVAWINGDEGQYAKIK